MIHWARPSSEHCFLFLDLESGDWQTDNMCENNDLYRPWLWVGRVDQKSWWENTAGKEKILWQQENFSGNKLISKNAAVHNVKMYFSTNDNLEYFCDYLFHWETVFSYFFKNKYFTYKTRLWKFWGLFAF